MSNYNNTNEKYEQKGQVNYLPTVSHPDPTEAYVGPPTSVAYTRKTCDPYVCMGNIFFKLKYLKS